MKHKQLEDKHIEKIKVINMTNKLAAWNAKLETESFLEGGAQATKTDLSALAELQKTAEGAAVVAEMLGGSAGSKAIAAQFPHVARWLRTVSEVARVRAAGAVAEASAPSASSSTLPTRKVLTSQLTDTHSGGASAFPAGFVPAAEQQALIKAAGGTGAGAAGEGGDLNAQREAKKAAKEAKKLAAASKAPKPWEVAAAKSTKEKFAKKVITADSCVVPCADRTKPLPKSVLANLPLGTGGKNFVESKDAQTQKLASSGKGGIQFGKATDVGTQQKPLTFEHAAKHPFEYRYFTTAIHYANRNDLPSIEPQGAGAKRRKSKARRGGVFLLSVEQVGNRRMRSKDGRSAMGEFFKNRLTLAPKSGDFCSFSTHFGHFLNRRPIAPEIWCGTTQKDSKGPERTPKDPKGLQRTPKDPKGLQRTPKDSKGLQVLQSTLFGFLPKIARFSQKSHTFGAQKRAKIEKLLHSTAHIFHSRSFDSDFFRPVTEQASPPKGAFDFWLLPPDSRQGEACSIKIAHLSRRHERHKLPRLQDHRDPLQRRFANNRRLHFRNSSSSVRAGQTTLATLALEI